MWGYIRTCMLFCYVTVTDIKDIYTYKISIFDIQGKETLFFRHAKR